MSDMRKVGKDEFDAFLESYPNEIEAHVSGVCDPPMISYNDFSGGKSFPDSIVAKTWEGTDEYRVI